MSGCRLHHVAVVTGQFDQYQALFEKLGMTVRKTTGEAPHRQLWFHEGIQLKEDTKDVRGDLVDHIALHTDDAAETVRIALENGCSHDPKGEKWFDLPNGVRIELMTD